MLHTNQEIAERIRTLAKERSITVKQTLEDCKINRNFIYDLDHSNSSPSIDKITRIANYFGVNVTEILSSNSGEIAAFVELFNKLSDDEKTALREYMSGMLK